MNLNIKDRLTLLELSERLAGVGYWRYEVESGQILWSQETYRIHGLSRGDVAPSYDTLLDLYLAEDRRRFDGLIARALLTGESYDFRGTIRRPDGQIRTICAKAECVRGYNGGVTHLQGVFQDVTEEANAPLFMGALADRIPAMVAYWDQGLICRFANAAHKDWFGRGAETMLGLGLAGLLGDAIFTLDAPHIRAALDGEPQAFERTLTKPSGEVGHLLIQFIPDCDDDGRVRGLFSLASDVTALKTSELELRWANARLRQAQMRGRVEAAADLGGGALETAAATPSAAEVGATLGMGGLRLLVVDDHAVSRKLVRRLTATVGMEVTEAASGHAALAATGNQAFDIILMDIVMPGLDGYASANAIRGRPGPNVSTPILAFSAKPNVRAAQTDQKGVFDGHVSKPIVPRELLSRIGAAALKGATLNA